jgi:hypothetical protein
MGQRRPIPAVTDIEGEPNQPEHKRPLESFDVGGVNLSLRATSGPFFLSNPSQLAAPGEPPTYIFLCGLKEHFTFAGKGCERSPKWAGKFMAVERLISRGNDGLGAVASAKTESWI